MLKNLLRLSGIKIALLLTLVIALFYFQDLPFLSLLELKTLDLRFVSRGKIPTSGEVVLVTIDEKSLDELGRWPWPRVRMAELLDALVKHDPKVVGFDIVWSEPDENSELRGLTAAREKLKEFKLTHRSFEDYLGQAIQKADSDRMLAQSIASSRRTILGYFFHFWGEEGGYAKKKPPADFPPLSTFNLVKFTSKEAQTVPLFEANAVEANIPIIADAAGGAGYFNIFPDRDGTVRWVPLVIKFKDRHYCALSLAVLQKFLDDLPLTLRIAEFGVEEIRLGDVPIPTNEEGRMLINYRGPQKMFTHYSASDVIHGRVPADALKGKIILVGATAMGIYDIRVTPFDHVFPGLEVHANVIDSILQQQFLHRPNWVALFDLLAIALIGFILGISLPRIRALPGALVAGVLFGAFILAARFLFQSKGVWVNMTHPLLNLVVIYLGITGYKYMTEEREKKKVRGAFQYYLSPAVVEQVLENPERLQLGGEKKELTVLFSDIRGFTSISERMSPEGLVKFMNEYLTRMTDIVFKHEGLLDKYIGDAIMAIWGAPLDQPDHPRRACATALEMIEALSQLQKKWASEGMPELNIGVGISTGPMVVGNMGSERRFSYTVMGDSVNLGSRLEGLNKVYGTRIIVSETTWQWVKEEILGRELDAVRVKGKATPVRIYELIASHGQATAEQRALGQDFQSALEAYRRQDWDEALKILQGILDRTRQDAPSRLYIERCQVLKKNPPPPDWDGVFTLTTK